MSDPDFTNDTIAIAGVGLIGGSLGLAFKRAGIGKRIIGISRAKTIDRAIASGAVDDGVPYESLSSASAQADVLFLCTPILRILEMLPETLEHSKAGCIVTDVGSTKAAVVAAATDTGRTDVTFIGGHPMAGSEWKGVDAADPFLFQNAIYVLTPPEGCDREPVDRLGAMVTRVGAHVIEMAPDTHDRMAAAISHVPQIMATALVGLVGQMNEKDGLALKMAAGGFRDMTRIASSPYAMWRDICQTNAVPIRETIDAYVAALNVVKDRIEDPSLEQSFSYANDVRDRIPKDSKGFLNPLSELMLVVEDKPGVIAEVATALANADINIRDIEVLKVREGEGGSIRLGLSSDEDRQKGSRIVTDLGYTVLSR
ncbi:MAG: prephenate dehydrogenase [Gemmatimonadetes bacterium]|nr:prephenate dehydrogenase [Gemmatimonadota bacterium]